jgi:hypothetical protein
MRRLATVGSRCVWMSARAETLSIDETSDVRCSDAAPFNTCALGVPTEMYGPPLIRKLRHVMRNRPR